MTTETWSKSSVNAVMRAAIDEYDWSSTALGPYEQWPQTLRTLLAVMLDSPFPMLIMWGDDLVQLYNDAFVPILLDKHPSSLGQSAQGCWAEIWHDIGPLLRGVFERGESVYWENMPLSIVRGGRSTPAYFTYSYSPIQTDGRIDGVICIANETTSHVLREREAVERAEALAALDRAKTQFFSSVSHEFRTPITLMLGPLEDLVRTLPDYQQREEADLARRNAIRLQRLVNALLDFSAAQSRMLQVQPLAIDVDRVTRDVASEFRSAFEAAGLALTVETGVHGTISLDPAIYEKILLNLLSNALKFTFEGEVVLTTSLSGDDFLLTVRDTGIGIAPQDIERVFQRFSRVYGARSRTHEGTGIGLALVHELVTLQRGDISVESTIGRGTTFTVRLPAAATSSDEQTVDTGELRRQFFEEAQALTQSRAIPIACAPSDAPHILIVDDNADLRAYLARLLSPRYRVSLASDGAELLERASALHPDLIVADVMMPQVNGFAALSILRSQAETAAIPVILLSARAGEDASNEGFAQGADDYIVKPFVAADLIARIDALLRRSRSSLRIPARERLESRLLSAAADKFITAANVSAVWHAVTAVLSPAFADWCVLYRPTADGLLPTASVHHADTAKVELGMALAREYPLRLGDKSPPVRAFETKTSLLFESGVDEFTANMKPERAAIMKAINSHSAMFVPIVAGGEAVGLIGVIRAENPQAFTPADLDFLKRFAERTALAYESASIRERESSIASTLQRALLPSALPVTSGLSLSASYVPAAQDTLVGGDWYDAFAIEGQRLVVTIGDVVGHGLTAATVMAKLRQAIRGFAMERDDAGSILGSVNRLLIAEAPGALATAYIAIVDAQTLAVDVASAGHHSAVVMNEDGLVRRLEADGLILGVDTNATYQTRSYEIKAGELVALFTDGFIEFGRDLEIGEHRFIDALRTGYRTADPASAVYLSLFGSSPPPDDAALVTVTAEPSLKALDLRLIAEPNAVGQTRRALRRFLASLPIDEARRSDLLTAAGEAVVNVIEHAYANRAPGPLHTTASADGHAAEIIVEDFGGVWDLDSRDAGQRGYGLPLIHALSDDVQIERGGSGTRVRITCYTGETAALRTT